MELCSQNSDMHGWCTEFNTTYGYCESLETIEDLIKEIKYYRPDLHKTDKIKMTINVCEFSNDIIDNLKNIGVHYVWMFRYCDSKTVDLHCTTTIEDLRRYEKIEEIDNSFKNIGVKDRFINSLN